MGYSVTLAFFKNDNFSYQDAKNNGAVYSVDLNFGEAHKGLGQTAVYDAMEIINAVKKCFGIDDEPLSFVLLDENNNLIDAG